MIPVTLNERFIDISLIEIGFQTCANRSSPCSAKPKDGFFEKCPNVIAPQTLVRGAASYYVGKVDDSKSAFGSGGSRRIAILGLEWLLTILDLFEIG
jgi:hypothetical protein